MLAAVLLEGNVLLQLFAQILELLGRGVFELLEALGVG